MIGFIESLEEDEFEEEVSILIEYFELTIFIWSN
jgi:hypothetical protein